MTSKKQASSVDLARDLSTLFSCVMSDADLMRSVSEVELSMGQFKTLAMLRQSNAELTLKEVSEEMGLSLPATSRAIDALCQRGYVERREDEVDRRMKRVRIAESGAEVMDRVAAIRIEVIARFLDKLPDADRTRLAKAISPILGRVEGDR